MKIDHVWQSESGDKFAIDFVISRGEKIETATWLDEYHDGELMVFAKASLWFKNADEAIETFEAAIAAIKEKTNCEYATNQRSMPSGSNTTRGTTRRWPNTFTQQRC